LRTKNSYFFLFIEVLQENTCRPLFYFLNKGEVKMEEWRDIPGYEGFYQISTHGRVKSLPRIIETGNNGMDRIKTRERILSTKASKRGYCYVCLGTPTKVSKRFSVHRLVAITFHPNPDNLPMAGHNDDNKSNNRVENIYWTTAQENCTHNDIHIKKGATISGTLKAKYAAGFKPYLPTKRGSREAKEIYLEY